MLLSLAAIVPAADVAVAAVNEIPQFNLDPTCGAVAVPGIGGRTVEICERTEQQDLILAIRFSRDLREDRMKRFVAQSSVPG